MITPTLLTTHQGGEGGTAGKGEGVQVSPCKNCEEREEYGKCHDRCIAYRKWYKEQLAEKKKLKADKKAGVSMEARIRRQLWKSK